MPCNRLPSFHETNCFNGTYLATIRKHDLAPVGIRFVLPLQRGHDGNLDAFWSFRPRQARPCCTCGPRQGDGANRANGRKRKSYRARTVQVHHQGRPGPSAMSFQAGTTNVRHVSLSNSTPIGSVQPRFSRKRVFRGGGVFWHFLHIPGSAKNQG